MVSRTILATQEWESCVRGDHNFMFSKTIRATQEWENCRRGANKSGFPGPYSQCKSERIAREVLTNHGFQDHTRNTRVRELHERCSQIMVFRNILAMQECENCTRGANNLWFPRPYSQCRSNIIAREVLTNHGFQDHAHITRVGELQEKC